MKNDQAFITPFSLRRIAERHGGDADVRDLLFAPEELPADARHLLVRRISEALAGSSLVHAMIARQRAEGLFREAEDSATILIASNVSSSELPSLVEHLRQRLELTPALLIHAVCSGRLEFFTAAMVNCPVSMTARCAPFWRRGGRMR